MPACLGHPAIVPELHQLKRDKGVASKVRKGGAEAILKRLHFRARCNPFRILLLLQFRGFSLWCCGLRFSVAKISFLSSDPTTHLQSPSLAVHSKMWTANLGDCGCGTRLQIVTRPANRRALRSPSAPDLPEGPLQCQRLHPNQ